MQLGELQSQLVRFNRRDVDLVAISVDPIEHSTRMIKRMKLAFPILSDQDQQIQKAYGVQNPDTNELALHAVFIIDQSKQILYRKVAGRRPLSVELLDAIDFSRGQYPLGDERPFRGDIPVAFPTNNFQALLEVSQNGQLPKGLSPDHFTPVSRHLKNGDLDAATITYQQIVAGLTGEFNEAELLAAAAWFTKTALSLPEQAITTGQSLGQTLRTIQRRRSNSEPIAALQNELDELRTLVRQNAGNWRLRSVKATLRGYRELTLAASRSS